MPLRIEPQFYDYLIFPLPVKKAEGFRSVVTGAAKEERKENRVEKSVGRSSYIVFNNKVSLLSLRILYVPTTQN